MTLPDVLSAARSTRMTTRSPTGVIPESLTPDHFALTYSALAVLRSLGSILFFYLLVKLLDCFERQMLKLEQLDYLAAHCLVVVQGEGSVDPFIHDDAL